MAKAYDLTGQTFGQLVVKERAGTDKHRSALWRCQCSCGKEDHIVSASNLRSGATKSCGCKRNKFPKGEDHPKFTHGGAVGSDSVEYIAWKNLVSSAHTDRMQFPEEWRHDFQQFFKAVGWKPSPKHELSRHDIRKPHSKENTYWSNPIEEREERLKLGLPQELAIDMQSILAQTGATASV